MRIVSGVLAIAGAVLIAVGCYVPYAGSGNFKLRIFDTKSPHEVLFFAIEPAAVAVAVAVLGILLLVRSPTPITSGVLLGTGVQTTLLFVGLIGYYAQSEFGAQIKAGGWLGILGGALTAAAGGVSLAARADAPATVGSTVAPGWYADPGDGGLLRYWTGSSWSEHTHPRAAPSTRALPPAPASPEPPVGEAQ
jgi:uncharacterized protein DUF2510